MKKYLSMLVIAGVLVSAPLCPSRIKTPTQLSLWMRINFTYQGEKFKFHDYWKTPEETVKDKGGDCEDFAFLAERILTDLNYDAKVIAIKYYGSRTGHSVCIIKENNKYTLFSNQYYYVQEHSTLNTLLNNNYIDWKYYQPIQQPKKYGPKIKRKK
ncbi:MAG: transglutaminase-like domain-containing protein [Promethearchaeota archaeon]